MSISGYFGKVKQRLKDRVRGGSATPGGQSPSGTSTGRASVTAQVPRSSSDPNLALSVPPASHLMRGSASVTDLSPALATRSSLPAPAAAESAPTTKDLYPLAPTVSDGKEPAWSCLTSLLRWLNTSANAFGPLKAAVEGLVECIDIYEVIEPT